MCVAHIWMSDQNIYFTLCVYFGEVQQAHMAHIRKKVHQAGANAALLNIFLRIYVQKPRSGFEKLDRVLRWT